MRLHSPTVDCTNTEQFCNRTGAFGSEVFGCQQEAFCMTDITGNF
jgi:hypothetical protein